MDGAPDETGEHDEIGQEPRFRLPSLPPGRRPRLPPGRRRATTVALAVACVAGVAALIAVTHPVPGGVGGASPGGPAPDVISAAADPALQPGAAPGTYLLPCGSATPTGLSPDWRKRSLHVGALWFVDAEQTGTVHLGRPRNLGTLHRPGPQIVFVELTLQYAGNTAAVLQPPPGAAANFTFNLSGGPDTALPPGETGFTFARCPADTPGPFGQADTFAVSFSIAPGTSVPVEVRTSPSARPVWLTFTAPRETGPVAP